MAYADQPTSVEDDDAPGRTAEGIETEDRQSTLRRMIEDAKLFVDDELSPHRALATQYYKGEPFGNEEEGRSQIVMTEVRDTIGEMLPSLLRVFFGPVQPVEFRPETAEDVQMAEQVTAYVTKVVLQYDNNGFLVFHSWFKDALLKRLGWVKAWCDETETLSQHTATGLPAEAVAVLQADPTVTITGQTPEEPTDENPVPTFTVKLTRSVKEKKLRVMAVPPEELHYNRTARTIDDALIVVHRTKKTRAELLEMGVEAAVLDEHNGSGETSANSVEEQARRNHSTSSEDDETDIEAMEPILYCEAYPFLPLKDNPDVVKLHRICTVGEDYFIVEDEVVDERPFAFLCPDPEPHTIEGMSPADSTMDLQKIKSFVFRAMSDSLSQSIFPRMAVVEGQVAMEDVLNAEIGAPIRQRGIGMVTPLVVPFVGKEAFPMLEYLDQVRERRAPAPPLNVDALQSSTKAAVAATVSASQQKIELIARIFAETGVRRLFRLILKLAVQHQPGSRMVQMQGRWQPLDPRSWKADLDVSVNIALGAGLHEEKLAMLTSIAAKQEQYLQTLGPENPLVSLPQLRNTLGKIIELSGRRDVETFFKPIDPNWKPQAPPEPPPDPNMMIAQAEVQKAQAEIAKKQADMQVAAQKAQMEIALEQEKLALQREEQVMADDRERDRVEADVLLRGKELELKYQTEIDIAQIRAAMERDRADRGSRKRRVKTSRDGAGKLTAEIEEVEE